MKKLYTLLLFTFVFNTAHGQNKAILKSKIVDIFTLLPDTSVLSWITTNRDFNQKNMTEDQIDKKIDSIIQSQKDKNVEDIETPINRKRLTYYNYLDFKKLGLVGDNEIFKSNKNEYGDADNSFNIFKYQSLTILCTYNAYEDQLNVYSIIRAFLILRNKYPELYKELFVKTENSPLLNTSLIKDKPNPEAININKNYVYCIHKNDKKPFNSTTTAYSAKYREALSNLWYSSNNTHFTFLNKNTLANGGVANGSNPIYKNVDTGTARIRYLFDGLIQTIVHERLHNYIGNNMTVNKFLDYMRNDSTLIRGKADANGVIKRLTYDYMEEPIVTNTTNSLFQLYGGISSDVMTYYRDLFNINQLPNMKYYTDYANLLLKLKELNTKCKSNEDVKILRISLIP